MTPVTWGLLGVSRGVYYVSIPYNLGNRENFQLKRDF